MKNRLNDFFWFGFTNKNISVFNEKSDYNLESSPLINGKKVSLEKALEEFRYLLKKNPQIHFDGLSSDQKSIDVVLDFAEKRRSSIDHMEAEEINNFFLAFQKYGASIISFNELKNRSDFVVFIGNFDKQLIESFFENIGWQRPKIKKSIFFVTENINSDFHNSFKVMNLLNTINSIPNILQEESICKKINQIKQKLKSSKYPVVVINPGNHFMVSEHIFKVVAHINNNIRKLRIFKFSGLNNSAGFINSCVTKTGYPNSISFNDWGVSYDPIGNSSKKQKDIAKLQIYISNFNLNPRIVKFKKNIFVGHPNFKERNSFDLFIPVKTPGIDMNGLVVRSDGCALVQLKKKMDSKYFKIADLIKEIDR